LITSALESSIHIIMSLEVPIKESLSHDSENCGNYYRRVTWRPLDGTSGVPDIRHESNYWPVGSENGLVIR
jgi:hypothetical protein